MSEQKWGNPNALGDLTIGLLILAQAFLLFGKVDPLTKIAVVPWLSTGFAILLIVVVVQLRNGDFVGATASGLLGAVLLGHNFVRGIIDLVFLVSGKTPSQEIITGGYTVDGMAFLCSGIILLSMGYLLGHETKWGAFSVWAAALGFLSLAATNLGLGTIFGRIGVWGLMIMAVWLIYSGIASLVNGAMQEVVLPLGKPLFNHRK